MAALANTGRNVIANVIGGAGFAILALIFNYLYYRILGAETYGLVTWFLMLSSIGGLFDFGMSGTTFRELARRSATSELSISSRSVVMTFQLVQWGIFLVLGAAVVALSPLFADWLNARSVPRAVVIDCIALSGICISVWQPRNLYLSGLNGLGLQVTSNSLQVCFSAVRGVATLGVLKFYNFGIVTFFIVQLIFFTIETLVSATVLWRALPAGQVRPRMSILHEVKGFAGANGAFLIAVAIFTTADKAIVSRFVPLDQFGQYGLITLVCLTLPRIATPFVTAYFHEFTVTWQSGDRDSLSRRYLQICEIVNSVLIAAGLLLGLFAFEIMTVLTGSPIIAHHLELPTRLYAFGSLLSALQTLPVTLQLAAGWATLAFRVYVPASLIFAVAVYGLTPVWGLVAPAFLWLAANVIMFPIFVHSMHKRMLPDLEIPWIKTTLVRPTLYCGAALLSTRIALHPANDAAGALGELTIASFAATVGLLLASSAIRKWTRVIGAKALEGGITKIWSDT